MDNLLANQEIQLSQFGVFLLKQRFIQAGHERYLVFWVRKFLTRRIEVPIPSIEDRIAHFLEELQACGSYKDWQVEQAEKAVRLYIVNFSKDQQSPAVVASSVRPLQDGSFPGDETLATLRTVLQMKHYSYTTERTYLDWARRFLGYLEETQQKSPAGGYAITSGRIKDFLAYLATRRNVAASTQNQAFGALLFLCREILHIEIGDLEHAVRAKRGPKLPVVLTVTEVQKILGYMKGTTRLCVPIVQTFPRPKRWQNPAISCQ